MHEQLIPHNYPFLSPVFLVCSSSVNTGLQAFHGMKSQELNPGQPDLLTTPLLLIPIHSRRRPTGKGSNWQRPAIFAVGSNLLPQLICQGRCDSLPVLSFPISFPCVAGTELLFANLLRSPGIDSQPAGTVRQPYMLYRPARQHRLAASIPRNRFLGSINVYKYGLSLCSLAGRHENPIPTRCLAPIDC